MTILDYLISVVWLAPLFYASLVILGRFYNKKRRRQVGIRKNVEKIIFQIPTIGNVRPVNEILAAVKNYALPVRVETWVVVEESDHHKDEYVCDRVVVVPSTFVCEDLYKSRALEYARRLRLKMVEDGSLTSNYLCIQGDDDALPSKEYVEECLKVDADIIVGTIAPRARGTWSTLLDYERCVSCRTICNFFTNIEEPIFGHGEGTCTTSEVDRSVSYDVSDLSTSKNKLISSEDLFYLHKALLKGFVAFNSEKRVFVVPPLSFRDAVTQRRRWFWGHLRILNEKLLPFSNRLRLAFFVFIGPVIYTISMVGVPLSFVGYINIPEAIMPLAWVTFILWLGLRAYNIGKCMGWKHAIIGVLASYVTITMNFVVNIVGMAKGDSKKFEVIRKSTTT